MKTMILISAALILGATACQTKQVAEVPISETPRAEEPTSTPSPVVGAPESVRQELRARLVAMGPASSCAATTFGNRGKPKKGYMKGITLTYAKAICNKQDPSVVNASKPLGADNVDALTLYKSIIADLGYKTDTGDERLRLVFTLMVGSAARESSFKWCVGRDKAATNYDSSTCEAGTYQTSYNGRYNRDGLTVNTVRAALYTKFKSDKTGCFAAEYKEGITCDADDLKNWGTGEGVIFQELSKQCPGFAGEYHMNMLRDRLTHYGPIKSKDALMTKQCYNHFADVEKFVQENPAVCSSL